MPYREFSRADDFLNCTGDFLKSNEVANGLMLGIALGLVQNPLYYETQPYFGAVERNGEIIVAALMTPPHKLLILSSQAVCPVEEIRLLAQKLFDGKWVLPAVLAREDIANCFGSAWSGLTGAQHEVGMRQRVHELRKVNPIDWPKGRFETVTEKDLELAIRWSHRFHVDCFGENSREPEQSDEAIRDKIKSGQLYFWHNEKPVSMTARARATGNGEIIALVYTPDTERRKGYASAVVASLASLILSKGMAFCSLYTDLANPTSNKIYRNIGFVPVADIVDINFTAS
jgi:predicted GNAT family acetyltransferase